MSISYILLIREYLQRRLDCRHLLGALVLATLAPCCSAQSGGEDCGELSNGFGPYDYRTERGNNASLVNGAHFTPSVESLSRGNTAVRPGPDIDYTLRAFPNHHRALDAVRRLGIKEKTDKPTGMRYTVDCWFMRAVRFKPDDLIVRMLYANFLQKAGRTDEAKKHMTVVVESAGDNPFTHYNAGLLLLELKEYELAAREARLAQSLGFPKTELIEGLKAAGKWTEAGDTAAQPASAASAASASAQ